MKVKYVGPHEGVAIHDALSGFSGSAERDGYVTPEPPDVVAARLAEQDTYQIEKPGQKARKDEE